MTSHPIAVNTHASFHDIFTPAHQTCEMSRSATTPHAGMVFQLPCSVQTCRRVDVQRSKSWPWGEGTARCTRILVPR